jgi:hypothetical protein
MPIHIRFDSPSLYQAVVNKLNGLRQLNEVAATGVQNSFERNLILFIGGNSKDSLEYLNLSWIRAPFINTAILQ